MKQYFIFLIIFIFSGCEIDTDESSRYEVLQLIDKGEFNSALNKLGDCANSDGFSEEECYLNRGVSYFGLAGYDITSIGEDLYRAYTGNLNEEEKSVEIISMLFKRFKGLNMSYGIISYKKALNLNNINATYCTSLNFETLTKYQQQACISINPILLLEVIDGPNSSQDNILSVDLEDLILIDKSIRGVTPNISDEDMALLLVGNGDNISDNSKNELDATNCLIDKSSCYKNGFLIPENVNNYLDNSIWKISKQNHSFTTLKLTNEFGSVLLVKEGNYITNNSEKCSINEYEKYDGICFPEPVENNESLTSTLVDKFNNDDDFKNSVALILNIDEKDSDEKVDNLMIDICDSDDCQVTEKNLLEYLGGE